MLELDRFKETFFQECDELLAGLEQHLSALAYADAPDEPLNAAFRAVHSIKGGAGMFGFSRLGSFAHAFETALDAMRSGRLTIDKTVIERSLRAADVLTDLANSLRSSEELPKDFEIEAMEGLVSLNSKKLDTAKIREADRTDPVPSAGHRDPDRIETAKTYRILFEPCAALLRRGIEPLQIIKSLETLGTLRVKSDTSRLPDITELDPTLCFTSWTFDLETTSTVAQIQEIFEFVTIDSRVQIRVLDNATPKLASPVADSATQTTSQQARETLRIADFKRSSIRVDLDRIERLVDLVGEMTIAQSMVLQQLDQSAVSNNPAMFRALSQLLQISRNLQEGAMAIRAQPIRSVFARMPRVAREVASVSMKKVQLVTSGEDTEIDKTIIEQLSDPLMHIVRNAIDHGIETPAERIAVNKPETGVVSLSATQRGGHIVVEVSDDGRGIDLDRVRQKAVDMRIISPDATLSDGDLENLIFQPGLSTARSVSTFSGRGVGMDVVLRNIQKIGGRVSTRTVRGSGTTTTITLPLTLAVLEAMLVRVGTQSFFIPLNQLIECLVVECKDINPVPGSGEFITVRGRQVPLLDLGQRLSLTSGCRGNRVHVALLETDARNTIGLLVDDICDHRQIVVKTIDSHFQNLPGVAGATIHGDGSVAIILDVTRLSEIGPASASASKPRIQEEDYAA